MKIVTVVGARPQFIKAAVVSKALRKEHREILVHTGQHFDYDMSEQFFEELEIPAPDYNLGISGGTHAQMTGKMMMAIEEVLLKEKPDMVLVYGDTNSTLAAALAAAKLYIPICHVEAGVRFHSSHNPEEINRIVTDHVSSILLACTESSMANLREEGLLPRSTLSGDPMLDAFLKYQKTAEERNVELHSLENTDNAFPVPEQYYYLTCHREENTGTDEPLMEIFRALETLDAPVIYPVHPRSKARALRLRESMNFRNIILTEPVGYLESVYLTTHAKMIITDSGGLQREAFFADKQCLTVLDNVAWPETMVDNRNQLVKPDHEDILSKMKNRQVIHPDYRPFGDGHASEKIVSAIDVYFSRH